MYAKQKKIHQIKETNGRPEDESVIESSIDVNQLRSENPNLTWKDLIGLKLARRSPGNPLAID